MRGDGKTDMKGAMVAVAAAIYFSVPIVFFFDGLSTLITQIRDWLKTGVWASHSLWEGLYKYLGFFKPDSGWVIIDLVGWWFLIDWSRAFGMMLLGLTLFGTQVWLAVYLFGLAERIAKRWKNL